MNNIKIYFKYQSTIIMGECYNIYNTQWFIMGKIYQGEIVEYSIRIRISSVKWKFTLFQLLCVLMFWHIEFSSRETLIYFVMWRKFLLVFTSSMLPCLRKHVINCLPTQHPLLNRSLLSSTLYSWGNTPRERSWSESRPGLAMKST